MICAQLEVTRALAETDFGRADKLAGSEVRSGLTASS